jgi:ribosomal protein L16 Arg81 hydroxylase
MGTERDAAGGSFPDAGGTARARAVLQWILAPEDIDGFFADSFERRVLHTRRGTKGYWGSLLSLADLDAVLGTHQVKHPDVRLVQSGKTISADDYTFASGIIDPLQVTRLHLGGATVIFSHLQDRSQPIADLVSTLSTVFSAPVQANVYLTPADAQGFPAHWDTHDVLILQISGSKSWKIYSGGPSLPLRGEHFEKEQCAIGPVVDEFEIAEGDVAYVPRGVIHSAHATQEASLHITVGILSYTWADLLLEAVADAALQDPRFRRSVSLDSDGWMTHGWSAQADAQWKALSAAIDLPNAVAALRSDMLARQKPGLANLLTQARRAEALRADSEVSLRSGARAALSYNDGTVAVEFLGQTIQCPASAGPALACLLEGAPMRVDSIPGELELGEKLVLAKRFVCEGLLEVAG